ncbi:endonuclease containing a URI domain [Legionella longbeachae]|nr:endonuclease containing a URI domain [Legionella longbeachae]
MIGIVKRQVFDIPLPKIEVTEHQVEVKYCECCNKTITAAFPAGVLAPVQYGEVIRSWSVYYQYQHFIPEDRLQQLFYDLYGIQLATATRTGYNRIAFDTLASFEESVLSAVKTAAVKNLDETGFRVAGKTQWLHVDRLVYFEVCSGIVMAIEREKQIKGWSRKKKHDLINALNPEWNDLYPSLL